MSQESSGAQGEPRDPNEQGTPPASDPYQQPPAYPYQQPSADPYQQPDQTADPYQQGGTPPYQGPPPYAPGGQTSPDQSTGYQSQYQSPYPTPPTAQYQYGPGPYGPPSPGTDGFSIAALVTGILGMAIVPIVLGIIGINRIKRTGQSGKGLAIAGIVLGAIAVVGWTLVIILFAAFFQSDTFDDMRNSRQFDSSVQEYGDDPELDALYEACEAGDDDACHELFLEAPSGSEYEEFGSTCGGREVVCFPF